VTTERWYVVLVTGSRSVQCFVEAFPPAGRAKSGTRNCMRLAEEAGFDVHVTEVE